VASKPIAATFLNVNATPETGSRPTGQPVAPHSQSAIPDLSLLRGICELPEPQPKELLGALAQRYQLVIPEVLIEETFVAYVGCGCDKQVARRIMNALVALQSNWVESPLELIFRELVLGRDIHADAAMSSQKASLLFEAMSNPDSLRAEAAQWLSDRRKEKDERLLARLEYQGLRKAHFGPAIYHFSTSLDFMECAIKQLCVEVDSPNLRESRLNRYLGRNLKALHPESAALIEKAFATATFDMLDRTRFTRNYLLAEILFDLAPICRIANQYGHHASIWHKKSGKQINDEEDQQYVAASLMFHRLLTCDERMHFIADLFAQRGLWPGKSIHVPRVAVHRLADFLL
jgi:hypothetical protein